MNTGLRFSPDFRIHIYHFRICQGTVSSEWQIGSDLAGEPALRGKVERHGCDLAKTTDNFFGTFGEDVEDPHVAGSFNTEQSFLAILRIETPLPVVVEEAVQAGTVNEDVLRV
jgi:hypothetical protein